MTLPSKAVDAVGLAAAAVIDMVVDGTGAVLACPWPLAEFIGRWSESPAARDLTPSGYRLAPVRPLEGELVRWSVVRRTTFVEEQVGHVVIGRERAAPTWTAGDIHDGIVYLVVT